MKTKHKEPEAVIRSELDWLMDIGSDGEWEEIIDELAHKAALGATGIDVCDGQLAHELWMLSRLRVSLRKIEAAHAEIKAIEKGKEPTRPKPESRYKRQLEKLVTALDREDAPMRNKEIERAEYLLGRRR
jgi:hypothetical protein